MRVSEKESVENGGDFPVVITYKQYNVRDWGGLRLKDEIKRTLQKTYGFISKAKSH